MERLIAGLGAISLATINGVSIPFLGVPLNVVTVAAFGAFVSFAWGEPVKEKKKLYMYALSSTFLAAVFVAIFPPMMGWEWVKPALQAPLAGFVAASMRFAIPPAIEAIPEIIRKIFRLDQKPKEGKADEK